MHPVCKLYILVFGNWWKCNSITCAYTLWFCCSVAQVQLACYPTDGWRLSESDWRLTADYSRVSTSQEGGECEHGHFSPLWLRGFCKIGPRQSQSRQSRQSRQSVPVLASPSRSQCPSPMSYRIVGVFQTVSLLIWLAKKFRLLLPHASIQNWQFQHFPVFQFLQLFISSFNLYKCIYIRDSAHVLHITPKQISYWTYTFDLQIVSVYHGNNIRYNVDVGTHFEGIHDIIF